MALTTGFAVAISGFGATGLAAADTLPAQEVDAETLRFDFGPGAVADGYIHVGADSQYSNETGYGFDDEGLVTETVREGGDAITSDFVTPSGSSFLVDLDNRDYTVAIVAGDLEGQTEISITSEEIPKVETVSRSAGEFLETAYEIALVDGQLSFDFAGSAPNLNSIVITPLPERSASDVPTAYLTGDSTMQTYDPYWEPQAGWGQMFDQFLTNEVAVDNQSIGGRSSRSFVQQGRLDDVLRSIRPGDYLFVQFGHNDATASVPERYTPPEQFRVYLQTYVDGAKQRGATPVLVTPVSRHDYDATAGEFRVSFPDYVQVTKEVADANDVPLVDLSASSRAFLDEIGPEEAKSVFLFVEPGIYPNRPDRVEDHTHFQEYGAIQMARLVALELGELGLPISDAVQVSVPDDVPTAPTGLVTVEVSSSSAVLSWEATEGADIYRIYRAVSGSSDFSLAATSTIPQKTVGSLEPGVSYDFRVSAVNARGEGDVGETITITTREAAYRYDFGPANSPVEEGYTQVTTATLYTEERGYGLTDSGDLADRDRGGSAGSDVERDFILWFGGRYEFKVDLPNGLYSAAVTVGDAIGNARTNVEIEGRDHGGISANNGSVERVLEGITVTDGQMNFVITGQTAHLNGITITPILVAPGTVAVDDIDYDGASAHVSLSWSEVDDAVGYAIYRTTAEGTVKVGEATETTFVDETAQPGGTATYAVATITATGAESVPSVGVAVDLFNEDLDVPAAPTGLDYTDIQKNSVSLSWGTVDGALYYLISRAPSADGEYRVIGSSEEASFTDEDVLTTVEYFYRVQAVNAGGASEYSDVLTTPAVTTLMRQSERLDRAPVAVAQDEGVFISWPLLAHDPFDAAFHIYRDGEQITDEPVLDSTNYFDEDGEADAQYRIAIVRDEVQYWTSSEFSPLDDQWFDIPLDKPEGGVTPDGVEYSYRANDISVADLDGDGELDILLKWDPSNSKDNSHSGYTGNVYLDAYKLDGTQLWRVDLGHNIRAGAHYSQPMVYDFDSDGKAEVIVKTADGTVDGVGTVIGDAAADYRNSGGYILDGPEFLTVFDGTTGAAIDTIDYVPARGDVAAWGDNYGNRVDRFLAGVAYLDGETPSAIFSRGYYTRTVIAAFDFDGEELSVRWVFDSSEPGNSAYAGQGNHSLAIADVDGDGKDEIIFGSATIDDDGTGLYSTGLGHGDAQHVSDFDPSRPGLEVYSVHESMGDSGNRAATFRDAATGEILWDVPGDRDTGRGVMADIDPRHEGAEGWSVGGDGAWNSPTGSLRTVKGEEISTKIPAANFVALWDGDLLSEIVDHTFDEETRNGRPVISKWDWNNEISVPIFEPEGVFTNNDTKGTPGLQADLFGDWREELIYRTEDSTALRVFTTTDLTEHRLWTLMSDPAYRMAIAWQLTAYNQPPHTSYFIGEGMDTPLAPNLVYTTSLPAEEEVPGQEEPGEPDVTPPTVSVKEGSEFTVGSADDGYELVSFKLFDEGQVGKVVINGEVKDLVNSTWSDVNFVKPGVFGAVLGANTMEVHDVVGNVTTVTFTLVEPAPEVPAWDAGQVYTTGDEVSHAGAVFVAQWWTQGETPGAPTGAWAEVGDLVADAGDGVRAWTTSWVYTGGEIVAHDGHTWRAQWWTRNQVPGDQYGPWEDLGQY